MCRSKALIRGHFHWSFQAAFTCAHMLDEHGCPSDTCFCWCTMDGDLFWHSWNANADTDWCRLKLKAEHCGHGPKLLRNIVKKNWINYLKRCSNAALQMSKVLSTSSKNQIYAPVDWKGQVNDLVPLLSYTHTHWIAHCWLILWKSNATLGRFDGSMSTERTSVKGIIGCSVYWFFCAEPHWWRAENHH